MTQDLDRKKRFLINFAYYALGAAIYFVLFRYVIYMAMPFVIALLVALCLRPLVTRLAKLPFVSKHAAAVIVVLIFYILIGAVAVWGIFRAIWAVANWAVTLPTLYSSYVEPNIQHLVSWIDSQNAFQLFGEDSDAYLQSAVNSLLNGLSTLVRTLSGRVFSYAQGLVRSVPKTFIATIFCIIATFFISVDYDDIKYFLFAQLNGEKKQIAIDAKRYLSGSVLKVLGSYGLIMLITMTEMLIGLSVLGVKNVVPIAIVIAVFDIMPALGTGGILLPWAVVEVVNGNVTMAVKLVVLYLIVAAIRSTIEPLIVGDSVGVHPLLMLLSMYVGGMIFGAVGIVVLPFTIVVVKRLNDSGQIKIFNSDYPHAGGGEKKPLIVRLFGRREKKDR